MEDNYTHWYPFV